MRTFEKVNNNEMKIIRTIVNEEVKSYEAILANKKAIEHEIDIVTYNYNNRINKLQEELNDCLVLLKQADDLAISVKPLSTGEQEKI